MGHDLRLAWRKSQHYGLQACGVVCYIAYMYGRITCGGASPAFGGAKAAFAELAHYAIRKVWRRPAWMKPQQQGLPRTGTCGRSLPWQRSLLLRHCRLQRGKRRLRRSQGHLPWRRRHCQPRLLGRSARSARLRGALLCQSSTSRAKPPVAFARHTGGFPRAAFRQLCECCVWVPRTRAQVSSAFAQVDLAML